MTNTIDLAAIKAACEGHTPGPWDNWSPHSNSVVAVDPRKPRVVSHFICEVCGPNRIPPGPKDHDEYRANIALIAKAPALLAECERLQGEVARLKVPMSVTEQDYRNMMRVNKGLVDKVTTLTTKLERCRFDLQEARREGSNAMDMWKKRAKKCKAAEADRDRLRGALEKAFALEMRHQAKGHGPKDEVQEVIDEARAALADGEGGDTNAR